MECQVDSPCYKCWWELKHYHRGFIMSLYHFIGPSPLPLGRVRFCVDKFTWSPTLYSSLAWHFILVWNVCLMWFAMIVSWAAIKSHFTCKTNCLTPLNLVPNEVSSLIWGRYPWFSLNRVNLVIVLMLLFSANSTIGHLAVQSFWSSWMIILRTCPIEQFTCSVVPSICGWNTVDMSSLVPMSLCSSCQNVDVNLVSWSNTIDLGTPWM